MEMNIEESYFSLHRYWLQANLMRKNFFEEWENLNSPKKIFIDFLIQEVLIETMEVKKSYLVYQNWLCVNLIKKKIKNIEVLDLHLHSSQAITYMDFWLSNLYTVIYHVCKKKPNLIYDEIYSLIDLFPNNLFYLRGCRNSVFHFESPNFRQKKINKLLGLNIVWANDLHNVLGENLLSIIKGEKPNIAFKHNIQSLKDLRDSKEIKNVIQKNPIDNYELSLCRLYQYWLRAQLMKERFYGSLSPIENFDPDSHAYMGFWYSMIYCVVEGYTKLCFSNDKINLLLNEQDRRRLIKYRHSFTKCHKAYFNYHLTGDLLNRPGAAAWINELHDSLGHYLLYEMKKIIKT